jgi:hypothetical protein
MGGGNRNSQSKAERRIERKQRREAANRQDHREKGKIREKEIKEENKGQPKKQKPWKRRDSDGSIILWNAIKVSKTSGYILGGMLGLVILFAISPMFEDPNYVEPERFSFAECEAIEFEDLYCMYDFKWTREYADGGTISEYAEFDPFVDLPDLGDKYTEEEQDFLPPTESGSGSGGGSWAIGDFILPLAYGEHDYLSGYAEHDKYDSPVSDEFGLSFVEDKLPEGKEDLTKHIKQLKLDLEVLEIELTEIEHDLQNWYTEEANLDNDQKKAERAYDKAVDDLDFAETTYRHAQDLTIRSNDDRLFQDAAFLDYKIQVRQFSNAEKTWTAAMNLYNQGHETHRAQEQRELELHDILDEILLELTETKTKLNLFFRDFQFISVNLSKTCLTMIEYGLQTACPTYREMVPAFDNTLRYVSGEFVDVGYDIKRLPSPLTDHWRYYEQVPAWRVVTVDADPSLFKRGVEITVQAKDFVVIERTGATDKTDSYNSNTLEQTTWKNIHVSKKCDSVTVGPDMNVIEAAILHVLNKCTTDLSEFKDVVQREPTIIQKEESAHWQYLKWIAELVKSLHDDSNTK